MKNLATLTNESRSAARSEVRHNKRQGNKAKALRNKSRRRRQGGSK